MAKLFAILLIFILPVQSQELSSKAPKDWKYVCDRSSPWVVGDCFSIHGRLQAGNGTPMVRIWRIGTRRMLGVHGDLRTELDESSHEDHFPELPQNVDKYFRGEQTLIYADFMVCPYTKQKAEEMQQVCIASATNLVIEDTDSGKVRRIKKDA